MPSTATSILDGLSTSVAVKAPCRTVATTNITLSGLQTISGYTTVDGDRVLVKGQSSAVDNGIYVASTGSWTRAKDADGNRDLVQGTRVIVRSTTIAGVEYELTTANPIVIGTTALTFVLRYSANVTYDQSDAEIAALVTPVDEEFPHGDLRRYGMALDGSSGGATAWASANAQAAQGGAPIYVPRLPNGVLTATGLTVDYRSDVVFEPGARLIYTGSSNVVALDIASAATIEVAFSRRYENLWVERQSLSDWTNEGNVGVRVRNAAGCFISITQINGFTIGWQALPSNGAGFQGNTIHCGHIYNCKIARDLSNATLGFANDNTFIGGRIQAFGTVDALGARYGDRITSSDGSMTATNGNRFYGTLTELNAPGSASEAVAILIEHGEENFWIDMRSEGNDLTMRCENASQRNIVQLGYSDDATDTLEQTDTASQNIVVAMRTRPRTHYTYPLAYFPDLGRKARGVSGTSILVEGLTFATSSASTVAAVSSTSVTYDGDYITLPSTRGMGLYVDTTTCKELVIRRGGTAGGFARVIAFDVSDNVLSTAGSVVGTDAAVVTYDGSLFGGSWGPGSDFLDDMYFRVAANVAYIWVFVCGGVSPAVISSFGVYAQTPAAGVRAYTDVYTSPGEIVPAYTTGAHATLRDFTATSTAAHALSLVETLVDDLKTLRILR
jgi:hypothetical protein